MIDDHVLEADRKSIIQERLDCWAINIDNDNHATGDFEPDNLYLHFSRRAILDYRKVKSLPKNLEKYLEKKHPGVYKSYLETQVTKDIKTIKVKKATIHSAPNKPTKMYLIKGDEVECLEEHGDWYKIRYYGKKVIEGWVRKEDVG